MILGCATAVLDYCAWGGRGAHSGDGRSCACAGGARRSVGGPIQIEVARYHEPAAKTKAAASGYWGPWLMLFHYKFSVLEHINCSSLPMRCVLPLVECG